MKVWARVRMYAGMAGMVGTMPSANGNEPRCAKAAPSEGKQGYGGVTRRLCMVPVDDAGRNPHRSQKSVELEANRC